MAKVGKRFLARTYGVSGYRTAKQLNRFDRMPAAHKEVYNKSFCFQNSAASAKNAAAPPKRKPAKSMVFGRKYFADLDRSSMRPKTGGPRRKPQSMRKGGPANRSAASKKAWATRRKLYGKSGAGKSGARRKGGKGRK